MNKGELSNDNENIDTKPVDNQGSHLAQDALGDIARSLTGQADFQAVLATLLCDPLKDSTRIDGMSAWSFCHVSMCFLKHEVDG